jgi:hypothetical protein
MKYFSVSLMYGLLCCMLSGCGHSGPERVIVSGAVTYEGHPVEHGVITFEPTDSVVEIKSSSQIENGHYLADLEGGVPVGNHKVLIQAYRDIASNVVSSKGPKLEEGPPQRQYLPAKYNTRTELKANIKSGTSPQSLDFALAP